MRRIPPTLPKIDPRQKSIVRRIPPTHSPAYIALVQSAIPAWATNSSDSRTAADPLAAHAVTAVIVVGNWPPIVESPFAADGFLGKPIVAKADMHIVRVAIDVATHGRDERLPCLPRRWTVVESFMKVTDAAVGYIMVDG